MVGGRIISNELLRKVGNGYYVDPCWNILFRSGTYAPHGVLINLKSEPQGPPLFGDVQTHSICCAVLDGEFLLYI